MTQRTSPLTVRLFHCARRGFTLVELLIVLAIVAMLVTMLLPAVSRAREATYIALCLGNMRQLGVSIGGYAAENKESIPPNINRTDGEDAWGPYQVLNDTAGGVKTWAATTAAYTGIIRKDNGMTSPIVVQDFGWTSGLGVMWGNGNIPYTLGGARMLWCPGERKANFMGLSSQSTVFGPGRYWAAGLNVRPNSFLPSTNGSVSTVQSSYIYRSLGCWNFATSTGTYFSKGPSKGSWRLSSMAPYTAVIDNALNIYGDSKANSGIKPMFTHGYDAYAGMNKLGYDGHGKWISDPTAAWQLFDPGVGTLTHDTGYGNSTYPTMWALYDAAN